ncbi:MAG: ankyrin repeat domain-containing protein [Fusobacteria bacterium]|nr:ankyrin repeat domain-containing protein [Fusobacteriota bacterium]
MYIKREEIIAKLDKISIKDIDSGIYPNFEILIYAIMKKEDKLFKKVLDRMIGKEEFYRLLDFSKETQSYTILHLATIENNIKAVESLLVNKKISPNVMTKQGLTPLMIAAKKGYYEITEILIKNGANINTTSKTKNSAIMYAASSNGESNYKIAKYLLEKDSKIDNQNKKGNTALIISAMKNIKIYNCLIEKGADTEIRNKEGKLAIDYYLENTSLEKTQY